jgi:hypothetical protein
MLTSPTASQAPLPMLLTRLSQLDYRFVTVTPDTHGQWLAREGQRPARSIRDVFGWNLAFRPEVLPGDLFELTRRAEACEPLSEGLWRATLRVASVGQLLFAHSPFPTTATDAVFFGPDSYRFARAVRRVSAGATRAVDVGCGSGVGGVVLAHYASLESPVVLADVNDRALALARVNASAAGVHAEVVHSDVLGQVDGAVDLVIANPPYLVDRAARAYRHGGGHHGAELSARIVRESLERLTGDGGGTLLLYTASAIVDGEDTFMGLIAEDLRQSGAVFEYEELDPDVFGSELREPAYADTERIAAVLLQARVGDARR